MFGVNKTGLIAKISIKYVLPTCIWKYFWQISLYFAFFGEFRGILRKYLNFPGPEPREISEAPHNPLHNYTFLCYSHSFNLSLFPLLSCHLLIYIGVLKAELLVRKSILTDDDIDWYLKTNRKQL